MNDNFVVVGIGTGLFYQIEIVSAVGNEADRQRVSVGESCLRRILKFDYVAEGLISAVIFGFFFG